MKATDHDQWIREWAGSVPNVVSSIYSCLLVKSLEYRIGGLNKNLTNGSSHAHVMDDQQEVRFCWKPA